MFLKNSAKIYTVLQQQQQNKKIIAKVSLKTSRRSDIAPLSGIL